MMHQDLSGADQGCLSLVLFVKVKWLMVVNMYHLQQMAITELAAVT
jgi:hypothetical protein